MPLWLSEDDVRSLVTPADAVPVIEECFRRMAARQVELMPRRRFALDGGYFAVMAATDRGLGVAGLKSYLLVEGTIEFVVCLFDLAEGTLAAMIAADKLGQVRTGAASGVAAKHLARRGAASLGLIGAGWQAESQLAAIRAAVPSIERVVVSSRPRERAEAFAEAHGTDVAESPSEAGGCDVVVTATSSKDPVLRGDWLSDGALVCAIGANDPRARELDWLEVQELAEIVSGGLPGRQADTDVVVFKSNGIAPWDLAIGHEVVRRARERGVGTQLDG